LNSTAILYISQTLILDLKTNYLAHIALEGCNKKKVVIENHVFMYRGKTPNVD